MTPLKQLLSQYFQSKKAIPAFNIDCFEIFQSIASAVAETKLPAIVQLSPAEDIFVDASRLYSLVKKANSDGLPLYLNLDHGVNPSRLRSMVALGYDMVHFDGSKLPFTDNLGITSVLKTDFSAINPQILMEGEFNQIGSEKYTDPHDALDFVTRTNIDLLAISIGNTHGVNENQPDQLNFSILKTIHQLLPNTFLTLHGGSGISADQINSAINLGVVKINVNTDLRLSFIKSLKQEINNTTTEKVYDILRPAVDSVTQVAIQKLKQFQNN